MVLIQNYTTVIIIVIVEKNSVFVFVAVCGVYV